MSEELETVTAGRPLRARRLGLHTQHELIVLMRTDCHVCRSEGLSTLIGLSSAIRDLPTRAFTRPDDYVDRSYLRAAWQRLGPEAR